MYEKPVERVVGRLPTRGRHSERLSMAVFIVSRSCQ